MCLQKKRSSICYLSKQWSERSLWKKIYRADIEGNKGRGRPSKRWMNGVKDCLNISKLTIQKAIERIKDRNVWRRIVGGGGRCR